MQGNKHFLANDTLEPHSFCLYVKIHYMLLIVIHTLTLIIVLTPHKCTLIIAINYAIDRNLLP